ncbi:cadherin domain-containing protein [Leptothoe sp. LEGE 181152]|nr:cadherin domain-containing protein [Leptothoe sp. LEGE 181152]
MSDGVFNPEVNGVVLTGDGGNNVLNGTNLNDQLFGLGGNDRLKGMAGADLLEGGIGNDWLSGGRGTDKLEGGVGNDVLLGGKGHDWLFGGEGADSLWGDGGNDNLSGGEGNDLLLGGSGNDLLDGGLGNDVIHLGKGSDIVLLAPGNGFDVLTDFKDGQDKIQLEGGLTFEDLDIRKHGRFSSEIRIDKPGDPNDGERLAKLVGIRPNKLTEDDFIFDDGGSNSAPTITSSATASVAENQTSAIDVETSDDNDSEGSGLTYSLSGGADQSLFSIDANSGVVTFTNAPDFEAPVDANGNNDYELQVTVTDSSGLTDTQDLVISVTDVAENAAPTITSSATASVPENQTSAIDVETSDDNDSEGSGLTYSLSGGADQSLFSIDANSGVVTFTNAPDFEAPVDANGNNDYELQVTVTDSSGLTDTQDLVISVTDVAENAAPTITSSATASVEEEQTSAIDVNATDDNDSEGSGLTYSLTGGADQALFSIDADTGVVTFNAAPDFENPGDAGGNNVYDIQVAATDSGGLTDVQDIAITVTDVVENVDPVAQNQSYSTFGNTVLEVAGADIPGNEVASVTSATSLLTGATDANGDTLSVLEETKTTTEGGSVTINADGSFFYTPEAGDASVADTFTFTVLDGNGGSSTATATINVSSDRIWYVDDDAAAGGDGTSGNPFNSLVPINTGGSSDGLDGAGDTIYVLDGSYGSGITLENGQSLLGQTTDLVVGGTTLISGANANRPTITGDIGLASSNTVQGIDVDGDITGSNVGSLTLEDVVFSNNGSNLAITNNTAGATLNILNNTLTPVNPTGTNLTRFLIDNNANNAIVNITGNTIDRGTSSGADVLRLENSGDGVTATISNNDIDADTGTLGAGSGIEVINFAGVLDVLVDNNTVDGTGNFHILIDSENNGTINATVTNNSVPSAIAPSIANNASLALNAEDNATLNISVTGNNMQSDNGTTGTGNLPFEADIFFIDSGANAVVNVAQALADISGLNNGDSVGQFGNNVNFGVSF